MSSRHKYEVASDTSGKYPSGSVSNNPKKTMNVEKVSKDSNESTDSKKPAKNQH